MRSLFCFRSSYRIRSPLIILGPHHFANISNCELHSWNFVMTCFCGGRTILLFLKCSLSTVVHQLFLGVGEDGGRKNHSLEATLQEQWGGCPAPTREIIDEPQFRSCTSEPLQIWKPDTAVRSTGLHLV